MKQYFQAFKYGVGYATTYRMRLFVWFLQGTLWIVALPFIWLTIYGSQETIEGFSKIMIITYFFFVPVIQTITFHYIEYEIQEDIKSGHITNFVIKPIHYLIYEFFADLGYKVIDVCLPVLLMFALYPFIKNFISLPEFSPRLLFIIPILLIGNLIGFFISAMVGMVAFWTTRAEWASHLWWMISTFIGGFIAPIEFFPQTAKTIISYTPFPLLIDTPISLLLGKISSIEILHQVIVGVVWIVILFVLTLFVYKRGVKRIEGIGI